MEEEEDARLRSGGFGARRMGNKRGGRKMNFQTYGYCSPGVTAGAAGLTSDLQ